MDRTHISCSSCTAGRFFTIGKELTCQSRRCKRLAIDPWVGKIPWRRAWQLTLIFLPGKPHGQKSLEGCSLVQLVQSLGRVRLFVTPWTVTCRAFLSITNSQSLLKLMSIQLSHPLSSPYHLAFNLSQNQDLFQGVSSQPGDQSIGASVSAPVLPMKIQG